MDGQRPRLGGGELRGVEQPRFPRLPTATDGAELCHRVRGETWRGRISAAAGLVGKRRHTGGAAEFVSRAVGGTGRASGSLAGSRPDCRIDAHHADPSSAHFVHDLDTVAESHVVRACYDYFANPGISDPLLQPWPKFLQRKRARVAQKNHVIRCQNYGQGLALITGVRAPETTRMLVERKVSGGKANDVAQGDYDK